VDDLHAYVSTRRDIQSAGRSCRRPSMTHKHTAFQFGLLTVWHI